MKYALNVVIPNWNGELYIEKCINSLIMQTYKNMRITVVDNASTDNSIAILEKYNNLNI